VAIAWSGPLEVVATACSAWLAYRAARASGLRANRVLLIAYGAQVLVLGGAWLLRGPLLALL
jgi:hypothetical protein